MKPIARSAINGILAAFIALLAGTAAAWGANGAFDLQALDTGRTISNGQRYGTTEPNSAEHRGNHFVPSAHRNLAAGRYRLLGEPDVFRAGATYVPPAPTLEPTLAVGQRFVRITSTKANDRPTAEVMTLSAVDDTRQPRRLTFASPGETSLFVDSNADVAHLPGLRPIEFDQNLERARRMFSGRDAWTLGVVALNCLPKPSKTLYVGGGTRVRIEGIFRVENLPSFHAVGQQNVWTRESAGAFWTVDPLIVVVRVPSDASVVGESHPEPQTVGPLGEVGGTPPPVGTLVANVGVVAPPDTAPLPHGRQAIVARESMITGCGVGTNQLSDMWELERTFTATSPAAHRSWKPNVRRAIAARRIIRGMARDAVAYVNGYPDVYGTVSEMNRLKTWNYDLPKPFDSSVTFDIDGRVTAYRRSTMLPQILQTATLTSTLFPGETPTEGTAFSCAAPTPTGPLPPSPKMLSPKSGATVSTDLKVILFDAPPDDNVNIMLEGSNGDYMGGGRLTAPDTVPEGLDARHVSQALVPTEHRRSSDPHVSTSNDPLVPVFTSGARYRVSLVTTVPRCPKRYLGDSGYFTVR